MPLPRGRRRLESGRTAELLDEVVSSDERPVEEQHAARVAARSAIDRAAKAQIRRVGPLRIVDLYQWA